MNSKVDFKARAKQHLAAAKEELSSGDERRLKYAALEIRMAMEAVTYERAQAYIKDIPPEVYETWQPKKLMLFLLEADPYADQSSTLSVGIEKEYGVEAKEMKTLGTEHILSLAEIKKNYDAIGSYLHMPTYKQLQEAKQNLSSLKDRCEKIIEKLEKVINSKIHNIKFTVFSEVHCVRCEHLIKKNIAHLKKLDTIEAKCLGCGATYLVENADNDQIKWKPKKSLFNCINKECNEENSIWNDELKPGTIIQCKACNANNEIALSVVLRSTV
ncbi:MAG: hypothetical protein WBK55_07715 [Alphaproteobacteria bacterium]